MDKFTKVTGVATPLMRQNVDTDLIIRIERLVDNVTREGLGPYCFEQLRFKPDGSEDPDCLFNQAPYRDAPIILARENFGCGSSREGAVWALKGMGIRAVIAPYFGDIFNNNCFQNGLLPVVLKAHEVQQLMEEARGGNHVTSIDLEAQTVTSPSGAVFRFDIDAQRKAKMLQGLDAIGETLQAAPAIDLYEQKRALDRPWLERA